MDDSAALLDASKRQSVAARRLSSLTISTAESQTHPVSYCTLEYDLNYHPEASDYPDALVVGEYLFEDFVQLSILDYLRAPFNISESTSGPLKIIG